MIVDASIVLFRPSADEVRQVADRWSEIPETIRHLRILVSADSASQVLVRETFSELGTRAIVTGRHDNLGFASGHNRLARDGFEAGADCVLVINPDIEFDSAAIGVFLQSARRVPEATLIGPWLEQIDEDGTKTGRADSLGIRWDASARHFDIGHGEPFPAGYVSGSVTPVAGVTGAFTLVPRAAYEKIMDAYGYFYDDYFLAYREDAELGIRAAMAGVPSVVVAQEGIRHVRSVRGSRRGRRLPDLLGVRNRFLMRWTLGQDRPGSPLIAQSRDAIVVLGSLTIERTSLPGLYSAFRIRRAASRRGIASLGYDAVSRAQT